MKTNVKWVLAGLGLLVIGGIFFSIYTNSLLKRERERVSYYSSLFEDARNEKDSLQIHADSIELVLARYEHLIDSLDVILVGMNERLAWFDKELEKAREELQSASYDDNYAYLQERYLDSDTLEYCFTKKQVKDISIDILTWEHNAQVLEERINIMALQEAQLAYKDEIIGVLRKENVDLNKLAGELYDRIAILTKDSYLKDEEIARLKKALRLWRAGAIGGGAFVVLVLLLV